MHPYGPVGAEHIMVLVRMSLCVCLAWERPLYILSRSSRTNADTYTISLPQWLSCCNKQWASLSHVASPVLSFWYNTSYNISCRGWSLLRHYIFTSRLTMPSLWSGSVWSWSDMDRQVVTTAGFAMVCFEWSTNTEPFDCENCLSYQLAKHPWSTNMWEPTNLWSTFSDISNPQTFHCQFLCVV